MRTLDPVPLLSAHPLVGIWECSDPEWANARFTVRATVVGFAVEGIDTSDGERFTISDVVWDGTTLRFDSRMESTGHEVEHEFTIIDRDRVRHRYSIVEVWVRDGG